MSIRQRIELLQDEITRMDESRDESRRAHLIGRLMDMVTCPPPGWLATDVAATLGKVEQASTLDEAEAIMEEVPSTAPALVGCLKSPVEE